MLNIEYITIKVLTTSNYHAKNNTGDSKGYIFREVSTETIQCDS